MKINQEKDIIIFHIGGGINGIGPVTRLLDMFGNNCVLYVFDARETDSDIDQQCHYDNLGIRSTFINKCIGGENRKYNFRVNKVGSSSSIYPPAKKALNYHITPFSQSLDIKTWEDNTQLDKIIEIDTINLNSFIEEEGTVPDVVSIDVQGAELDIMRGCEKYIEDIFCIVSEVEFTEIYEGQPLFQDQAKFLKEAGFKLVDIMNPQRWHPAPVIGEGFLTVGEALWFKDLNSSYILSNQMKVAAVAFSFNRISYMFAVLERLITKTSSYEYVKEYCNKYHYEYMFKVYNFIKDNLQSYEDDPKFFMKNFNTSINL